MNIITKSGTNSYHGTLFEFLRNDDLDARDYFQPGPKVPLKLNQFGGNLAGPLYRSKLFFFVNYEGDRTHLTNPYPQYEVPSAYVLSQFVPSMAPIAAMMAPTIPVTRITGHTIWLSRPRIFQTFFRKIPARSGSIITSATATA
jgi:hypothetical protein